MEQTRKLPGKPVMNGWFQGFHYEIILTKGVPLSPKVREEIVQRIAHRKREGGKPCFRTTTEESTRQNIEQGIISAYLFIENRDKTDRASCSIQFQNHCGLPGGPNKVWVFDLCRTYEEGKKGTISPTGILFDWVQQYTWTQTRQRSIYLMVDNTVKSEHDILVGVYNGYGFKVIPNQECMVQMKRTIMVRNRRILGKTIRGGRNHMKKRKTYKR
jgi:hypothetical protein